MQQEISITPFEEQVLMVMEHGSPGKAIGTMSIAVLGYKECGYPSNWTGPAQQRKKAHMYVPPTFPKINLALGRLAKKGLVARIPNHSILSLGYASGVWMLTDEGKLLLGLDSNS